ncbi:MAG: hypothetical protein WAN58_00625 [Anaerolineales bacterium]
MGTIIKCSAKAKCAADQHVQITRLPTASCFFTMQTRTDEPSSHHSSKIELVNDIQLVLKNWNDLSQLKHKKLFRLVLERAFARQNAFTAGQSSFAFQPLQQSQSLGLVPYNSGEGGRASDCAPAIILPPGTSISDGLLVIDYRLNKKD